MKKSLSSLLLAGLLLSSVGFGGSVARAADINGEDSTSITVNGSLGQDNTDEDTPNIDEGSKEWIDVTLSTANIFYTTKSSDHKTITSPDYTITNNSGRAVKISVEDFTVNTGTLNNVDTLEINAKDYSNNDQTINLKTLTKDAFVTLANINGKLNVDTDEANTYSNETNYKYSGTTKDDYYNTKSEKTTHTLTLAFEALDKDGQLVVKP